MQRRTNARPTPSSRNLVKISLSISLFATLGCDMIERGPVSYAPGFEPASSISSAPSVSAAPSVPRTARQVDTGNQALIEAALETMRLKESGSLEECLGRAASLVDRFEQNPHAELVETLLLSWCRNGSPVRTPQRTTSAPQRELAQQELASAEVFLEKNDVDSALESLERAYAFDPSNGPIQDRLLKVRKEEGLKRYSRGELDGALILWQRVLEIDPQDAESLRYVARAKAVSRQL